MRTKIRTLAALFTITAGALLASAPARAEYPDRPVKMIVGFAPGGAADVIARIIAQSLSKQLGQPVVVENRPGADATIAANAVRTSPPDGYTIMLGTNTAMVAVPSLRPNPPYDPFKDFTPLSTAGAFSMFLVVNPKIPAKNVAELVEWLRANPGKANYATSNSAAELAMVQLLAAYGLKATVVRYKGDAAALTDLMQDQIQMMFATGTAAPQFVKDGRMRALATPLANRSPLLPDVPTAAESGLRAMTIVPWAGVFGPAGMPPEIVDKLSRELRAALARPDAREQMSGQGFESFGSSSQEFTTFFREQYDTFTRTVREQGLKFD